MNRSIILFLLTLYFTSANAVFITSDITDVDANSGFYSKEYVNNTNNTNIYQFDAYQINRPGKGEIASKITNGDVIYAPLKKVLLPKEREFFKIFYRGPKDNQERYYRVIIRETSLGAFEKKDADRNIYFLPTVALDSYLVIRPKDIDFKYNFDKKSNYLKNTGNTYFSVIINSTCDDENPDVFYLLPGQSYENKKLMSPGNKFIVYNGNFILFDDKCSTKQ